MTYRLTWDSVGDRYFYLLWKDKDPVITVHPHEIQTRHHELKQAVEKIRLTMTEFNTVVPFKDWGPMLKTVFQLELGEEVTYEEPDV